MKHITAVAICLAVILVLTACAGAGQKAGPSSSARKTEPVGNASNVITETEPVNPIETGVSTEPVSTEAQTEDSTADSLKLNTDLLDEYKMTFAELTEKHGKIVNYTQIEGGSFYRFENGYGYYGFDIPANTSLFVTDPESGLEYMPISDDELCRWIFMIEPESLFGAVNDTLSVEELSGIDGLTYIGTYPDGIASAKAFCSQFHYQGWDSDKVTLDIYHDDEDVIDPTSEIRIYIHPLNIAAENGD